MKSAVIYYSQTGNTKKVAQAIHRGLQEGARNCDLLSLEQVDYMRLSDYDLIGIGCPVWSWKEPPNVRLFLEQMQSLPKQKFFLFATHGPVRGTVFESMSRIITAKRGKVIASRSWYGGVLLQYAVKPHFCDGHPDAIDLQEAFEFGRSLQAFDSFAGNEVTPEAAATPGPAKQPASHYASARDDESMHLLVNIRHVPGKCTYPKCRICIDHCPMGAIDLSKKTPQFMIAGRCIKCYYCELVCPTGAIEADWAPQAKWYLESVFDTMRKLLDKGEAKGYFRRLTPLQEVGAAGAVYQAMPGHPRFKVGDLRD